MVLVDAIISLQHSLENCFINTKEHKAAITTSNYDDYRNLGKYDVLHTPLLGFM